jgi:hypothetical protein
MKKPNEPKPSPKLSDLSLPKGEAKSSILSCEALAKQEASAKEDKPKLLSSLASSLWTVFVKTNPIVAFSAENQRLEMIKTKNKANPMWVTCPDRRGPCPDRRGKASVLHSKNAKQSQSQRRRPVPTEGGNAVETEAQQRRMIFYI